MAAAQTVIPSTTPSRAFGDHKEPVLAVAALPNRRRMVTGSKDKTLRLRDLTDGVTLKKMEGHDFGVRAVAVSRDGQLIASGDDNGELISWQGDTGERVQVIKAHSKSYIFSLDFSPDGAILATGSQDRTTKLWNTETWQLQGNPIICKKAVFCVRYSPSGDLLAIATSMNIQIWRSRERDCIADFPAATATTGKPTSNASLAWMPDGTRLFSGGSGPDPTMREWDTLTWKQVDDPWKGHSNQISAIVVNSAATTLIASASHDNHVRLWRYSDRQTIAIFDHSSKVCCATFSRGGEHILSGSEDGMVLEWVVPEDALLEDDTKTQASKEGALPEDAPQDRMTNKILAINTITRKACISGTLRAAEDRLTHDIDVDPDNYSNYLNRSFVMARKLDWGRALQDALKSLSIQTSLTGYICMSIAHCGKQHFQDAMKAIDLAFMFTDGDSKVIHFLLLIKAIMIFNANQHDDAMARIRELADACPDADTLACHVVEAYLRVQLGTTALNGGRHNEAADHFAVINTSAFSSKLAVHSTYEDLVMLFGWDLKLLWWTLLRAGRLEKAAESYRHMMDMSDDSMEADYAFTQECSKLCVDNGDAAFHASNYDHAIGLYSAAIKLDSANDTIFAKRSKAKSEKMLWEEALLDAQKVIELNPSSYFGYQLKHAALHGAQRYDDAIDAFRIMLSKVDNATETQIRKLRQQYLSPSEAEGAIRKVIETQLRGSPYRLLNISTGCLCDGDAQINAFKASAQYKELLSFSMTREDLRTECIKEAVAMYFRRVMLSHRWEEKEPLLPDIQEKVVYSLNPVGGIVKLQSFCKVAHKAGYHWAWVDTCCIDQNNHVELQKSLTSMFAWYRNSALTIVYLSDVPPLSKSGALAKSTWNTRGWTVPEFLASKVVLFYQSDWTLYLDDRCSNHKESVAIMRELGDATGIDTQALVAFHPGMGRVREKLQWVSTRVTTVEEDNAYSLVGIFGVHLPIIYGEMKHNALGRLLQEIVARSGDTTALDWVGKSSEFNSCLPADITSYEAPPYTLPSLSEDDIQTLVSSLRGAGAVELASKLYTMLDNLSAPRFANCRLRLPCIVFPLTEIRPSRAQDRETCFTYEVKAAGLCDLSITTEDKLNQFSLARLLPTRYIIMLVRPWNRCLVEIPDYADDTQSMEDWSNPGSPLHDSLNEFSGENEPVDTQSHSQALRLIVRLGQPFGAFLLARQRSGEYKRIASDCNIIAQVKDVTRVRDMMNVKILEIL